MKPSPQKCAQTGVTALLMTLGLSAAGLADSWVSPFRKEYCSANGTYCFAVIPRDYRTEVPASGTLTEISGAKDLWRVDLLNELAPVTALVSGSGRYVVTFDDWYKVGFGENVVVIYGPEGKLVRNFRLEELMTPTEIETYTLKSTSSRWWGGLHRIDEAKQELVLEIANDADAIHKPARETMQFRYLRIDLKTGKILTP